MREADFTNELTRLAYRMNQNIPWPRLGEPDDAINLQITAKCRSADQFTDNLTNVYTMGGYSPNYCVKLTICGKQYRIGIFPNRLRACRFADVAILYFWKYRSTERQPEDSDFNTTLADAQMLTLIRPEVLINLQMLEEYFVRIGAITAEWNNKKSAAVTHDLSRDILVARKYLERSRRYIRSLREQHTLTPDAVDAVELMETQLTEMLDNFSATFK